jgi:hypothetical protein
MPLPSHVFAGHPISQVALGGSDTSAITNQGTLYRGEAWRYIHTFTHTYIHM